MDGHIFVQIVFHCSLWGILGHNCLSLAVEKVEILLSTLLLLSLSMNEVEWYVLHSLYVDGLELIQMLKCVLKCLFHYVIYNCWVFFFAIAHW